MTRIAWLLLAWLAGATLAPAAESILSYDSVITVQGDGTLDVRETIRVVAEGDRIRRGIYRDYPTIYPGRDGGTVSIGFAFQSATRDGVAENWRQEPRGNGVRIYVGDPATNVPRGEHTYELVYRTDRQMGFFADHDELYWNVTGNGWDFPIGRASARVVLPAVIPRADVRMEAYTGPQGAKGQDFRATLDGDAPFFVTTRGLGPREGLTIVTMFPKGFVTQAVESALPVTPTPSRTITSAGRDRGRGFADASDRRPLYIALAGLLLLAAYYYWAWNRVGRDPPRKVIIPHYEPPPGTSPAALRYLLQMSYDDKCLGAAVLSLAVKGHLRIDESDGFLGLGKSITLVATPPPSATKPSLSKDEKALLTSLFKASDRLELRQENRGRVRAMRNAHSDALEQAYSAGFFEINGGWHLLGIVFSIAVIVGATGSSGNSRYWPDWFFGTPSGWITLGIGMALLVVNGVFGKLLRAPTVAGQAVMDQVRGFRMYLDVAEGEELKRIAGPPLTPQLFESYLPAALALSVEQRWAERFAGMFDMQPDYQPAWYQGAAWNVARVSSFSSGISSSLASAISSSSESPGSRSGGGGGGSSGGGGGGGGGGGW